MHLATQKDNASECDVTLELYRILGQQKLPCKTNWSHTLLFSYSEVNYKTALYSTHPQIKECIASIFSVKVSYIEFFSITVLMTVRRIQTSTIRHTIEHKELGLYLTLMVHVESIISILVGL